MGRTAVIVDDDGDFCVQVARLLESAGYEVIGSCPDGGAALALLSRRSPDLVVLDVQLPDIDGFGVIDRLDEAAGRSAIVLVSSREAADYGSRIGRSGAAGFITKAELSAESLARVVASP